MGAGFQMGISMFVGSNNVSLALDLLVNTAISFQSFDSSFRFLM
jgi:hypothetical protein